MTWKPVFDEPEVSSIGSIAVAASDPNVVYAGEYLGIVTRFDLRTRQARNVSAYPDNLSGHGAADGRYRFQWTAPILVSPHDRRASSASRS